MAGYGGPGGPGGPGPEVLPFDLVAPERSPGPRRPPAGRVLVAALRTLAALVAGLAAALLATGALVGTWARDEVLDTDAYVAAIGPVATSTAVQDEVAGLVGDALDARLQSAKIPDAALPAARDAVRTLSDELVRSPEFARLWTRFNRAGHLQVVRVLQGDPTPVEGASVTGGVVRVDLTPAADAVRARVADAGLPAGVAVPRTRLAVDVVELSELDRLRPSVDRVDRLANAGPWAALAALALALAVARRRLVTVAVVGVLVAAGAFAVRLTTDVARTVALDRLDAAQVPASVAPVVVDGLTDVLRSRSLYLGLGALAVSLLAVLALAVRAGRTRTPRAKIPITVG